jgi:hypothetical protein
MQKHASGSRKILVLAISLALLWAFTCPTPSVRASRGDASQNASGPTVDETSVSAVPAHGRRGDSAVGEHCSPPASALTIRTSSISRAI